MTDCRRIYSRPSAAETGDITSPEFDVRDFWAVEILTNVTAQGGAFNVRVQQRVPEEDGGTGVWQEIGSATIATPSVTEVLVCPGGTINAIPGFSLRVVWDLTTSATFSADIIGR